MILRTSDKVKKIQDEIQSLKVIQPINGGALTKHAAQQEWQGTLDRNNPISQYSLLAAFEVTYTRTDGVIKPPLVQFAYLLDPDGEDLTDTGGSIISIGESSVTFRISIYYIWWPFGQSTTGNVKLTCSAYSPVPGYMTLKRVYS